MGRRGFPIIIILYSNYIVFIEFTIRYFKDYTLGFFGLYSMSYSVWDFYGLARFKNKELVVKFYVCYAVNYFPEFRPFFVILEAQARIWINIDQFNCAQLILVKFFKLSPWPDF